MKNVLKYTLIAASTFATACTDLDEEVFDQVISEQFVPTEEDLPALMAPVYSAMRPIMADWRGYFDMQEESADIIVTPARPNGWVDGGIYQRMHWHTWSATDDTPTRLWGLAYNGINAANRVIYQIESGAIPVAEGREALLAELRVARAFYYYLLCDAYGNVPLAIDFTSAEPPAQNTRQEVYDFIIEEVSSSLPLLDEQVGQATYGRFNRWAALALLARLYLNAEVYTGTPAWEECIQVCDEIISSGNYRLETSYTELFKTDNENSVELIFTVPYDQIQAPGFILHMKTLHPSSRDVYNMQATPWGGNCAVPQFIDTYDEDDSRLEDTWIMGPQYNSAGEEVINYVRLVPGIEATEANHGYRIGKYEIAEGATGALSNDYPVFRYAGILMTKAECLLRLGQADAAAGLVSSVRERAFAGTNPAKAAVSGEDLRQGSVYRYGYWEDGSVTELQGGADIPFGRFLDELGWEFAAEGRRRVDLIRFGVFSSKMWFQHRPQDVSRQLFPIPQNALDTNPNLEQNPGYN